MENAPVQLLTHSRSQCAKTCLRKHFYQYELGIRPVESSKPLRMGTAIHEGLDRLAQGVPIELVMTWVAEHYATCPDHFDAFEWQVECQTVMRLLSGYAWRWAEYRFEVVATEQVFQLPIVNPESGRPTPNFDNAGKIDKVIRLSDSRLAVMEHKTSGGDISPNSDYWRRLRMDSQITRYMGAAKALGHEVECVVYDVIRKPGIQPKKVVKADAKQIKETGLYFGEPCDTPDVERETPTMFGARLTSDISERPDFYYQRQEIARLDADMAEFAQDLWDEQKNLRECQKSGRWPKNTAACLEPYRCQYFDLCSQNWKPNEANEPPPGFTVGELHPELSTTKEVA